MKEAVDLEMSSIRQHHAGIEEQDKKTKDQAMKCLEAVFYEYLERCTGKSKKEIQQMEARVPGGEDPGAREHQEGEEMSDNGSPSDNAEGYTVDCVDVYPGRSELGCLTVQMDKARETFRS